MRARLLACLLPAALATAACDIGIAADGLEGKFDREFTVSGPLELDVRSGSGDIYVRTGPDNTVRVYGRVRASNGWVSFSGRSAQERIREIERNPPIEQSGSRIDIGPRRGEDDWRTGWNGVSISYEIIVPANARVTSRSGSGDLEVGDVAGPVIVSTGSGDIRVGRITDDVEARTGSGDIEVAGAGSARTSTGSGNVMALGVRGNLEARSGSGDITVTQEGKGSVQVSTGSGDIELEGTPASDWEVSASSGDVRLRLPSKGSFDLDLRSNSGRIETMIPITISGAQSRRELRGQVGGGGPRVQVNTSSGAIIVQ
jgi:hypothetical protein